MNHKCLFQYKIFYEVDSSSFCQTWAYFPNFSICQPRIEPRINVITRIGTSVMGAFQPIRTAHGRRTIREMMIPFRGPFTLMSQDSIRKTGTIHKENADISVP